MGAEDNVVQVAPPANGGGGGFDPETADNLEDVCFAPLPQRLPVIAHVLANAPLDGEAIRRQSRTAHDDLLEYP